MTQTQQMRRIPFTADLVPVEPPTQTEYPDIEPDFLLKQQLRAFLRQLTDQYQTLGKEIKALDEKRTSMGSRSYELSQDITSVQGLLKRFPDNLPSCEFDPD